MWWDATQNIFLSNPTTVEAEVVLCLSWGCDNFLIQKNIMKYKKSFYTGMCLTPYMTVCHSVNDTIECDTMTCRHSARAINNNSMVEKEKRN